MNIYKVRITGEDIIYNFVIHASSEKIAKIIAKDFWTKDENGEFIEIEINMTNVISLKVNRR